MKRILLALFWLTAACEDAADGETRGSVLATIHGHLERAAGVDPAQTVHVALLWQTQGNPYDPLFVPNSVMRPQEARVTEDGNFVLELTEPPPHEALFAPYSNQSYGFANGVLVAYLDNNQNGQLDLGGAILGTSDGSDSEAGDKVVGSSWGSTAYRLSESPEDAPRNGESRTTLAYGDETSQQPGYSLVTQMLGSKPRRDSLAFDLPLHIEPTRWLKRFICNSEPPFGLSEFCECRVNTWNVSGRVWYGPPAPVEFIQSQLPGKRMEVSITDCFIRPTPDQVEVSVNGVPLVFQPQPGPSGFSLKDLSALTPGTNHLRVHSLNGYPDSDIEFQLVDVQVPEQPIDASGLSNEQLQWTSSSPGHWFRPTVYLIPDEQKLNASSYDTVSTQNTQQSLSTLADIYSLYSAQREGLTGAYLTVEVMDGDVYLEQPVALSVNSYGIAKLRFTQPTPP